MSNDINDVLGLSNSQKQPDSSTQGLTKKYPALRTLSGIIAFIAWTVAILALIIVFALLSKLNEGVSWIFPVGTLVVGTVLFIALLAYAEIIKVFVDIEENTRKTAMK